MLKWYRIPGEWELTIFLGPLQIRIGNVQQAAWLRRGNRFAELFNRGSRMRKIRAQITEGVGG